MTGYALDHPLVVDYLRRIDAATAHLAVDEGTDVRQGIREHLAEALSSARSDADVRNVLDAVGQPEDIVDAPPAQQPPGAWQPYAPAQPPANGRGALEIIAVVLLLIGGFVVPVVGWIIGVVLLWMSKAWTTGQKLLGTLVLPGGIAFAFLIIPLLAFIPLETCTSGGELRTSSGGSAVVGTCTGFAPAGWMTGVAMAVAIVAPILVAIYLLRAAGRSGEAASPA